MKKIIYFVGLGLFVLLFATCSKDDDVESSSGTIIDHSKANLTNVSGESLKKVRTSLKIAYGYSSWEIGYQIIQGMRGLVDFKGSAYRFSRNLEDSVLYVNQELLERHSLVADDSGWYNSTREFLKSDDIGINVVFWCWGREVSNATSQQIDKYLTLMSKLETEFPSVKFVYMTGPVDGTGTTDNLYLRNEQIRKYCKDKSKILFDFADIESYDPNGKYYGDKLLDEDCSYDSNGDGIQESNWATDWQNKHEEGVEWFNVDNDETEAISINQKAYALWNLFVLLAK